MCHWLGMLRPAPVAHTDALGAGNAVQQNGQRYRAFATPSSSSLTSALGGALLLLSFSGLISVIFRSRRHVPGVVAAMQVFQEPGGLMWTVKRAHWGAGCTQIDR